MSERSESSYGDLGPSLGDEIAFEELVADRSLALESPFGSRSVDLGGSRFLFGVAIMAEGR